MSFNFDKSEKSVINFVIGSFILCEIKSNDNALYKRENLKGKLFIKIKYF